MDGLEQNIPRSSAVTCRSRPATPFAPHLFGRKTSEEVLSSGLRHERFEMPRPNCAAPIQQTALKPAGNIVFKRDIHVPSLLTNHTLHVHVAQFEHVIPVPGHPLKRYDTIVLVNGLKVLVPDLPVRNGALHVTDKLLHPLRHRGHHKHSDEGAGEEEFNEDWEDWEDWLPAWAQED